MEFEFYACLFTRFVCIFKDSSQVLPVHHQHNHRQMNLSALWQMKMFIGGLSSPWNVYWFRLKESSTPLLPFMAEAILSEETEKVPAGRGSNRYRRGQTGMLDQATRPANTFCQCHSGSLERLAHRIDKI